MTVLRCMTSLTDDSHAGIGARATSKCTEIIIRPTRTHDVLDEKGRQSRDSRLLCRDHWILREQ